MSFWPLLFLLFFFLCTTLVLSSEGDRDFSFRKCVEVCVENGDCGHEDSVALKLLFWTCEDDCRYKCTHSSTRERLEKGAPVVQYFGKWPFARFCGLQEPASVIFSLLNGWAHYRGLLRLRGEIHQNYEFRPFLLTLPYIGINLWLWSSVFQ